MTITVIVCTYNRCQSLAKALDSVCASIVPAATEWEVLVVDNNSSDGTREVAEDFCRRYPDRFRYLFERRQGKSYALNAGVREARGSVLAFMDDDVVVQTTWLQNLTACLQNDEWAGSGGRILAGSDISTPHWLSLEGPYNSGGILALFDLGDKAGEISRPPFGTNMAFQKRMFEEHGDFRVDLGPRPGTELRNEDTEFGRRLMSAGERLRYEPSAVVYHEVPEARLRKAYFLAWWFAFGRAQVLEAAPRAAVWGIPRHYFTLANAVLRILPSGTLRWMLALDPQRRFHLRCMVWKVAGNIAETWHQLSVMNWRSMLKDSKASRDMIL